MTNQEIFNKVATHLLTQNKKSESSHSCLYRDSSGNKCAIGCLIKDEFYDPRLEDEGVVSLSSLLVKAALEKSGVIFNGSPIFLRELQRIHDEYDVEDWHTKLADFAKNHALNSDVLNKESNNG